MTTRPHNHRILGCGDQSAGKIGGPPHAHPFLPAVPSTDVHIQHVHATPRDPEAKALKKEIVDELTRDIHTIIEEATTTPLVLMGGDHNNLWFQEDGHTEYNLD